ncbi:Vegetative incompatibility protein HET-E-1 [Cladobotryum mycophilum]|uniref:Vegetative incompatibility protein HET-E-1 n=1 Tax=Cladobotryum mycophilum TaxID=491253 RepID=A0ABR0SQN0_9HYPO
MPTPSLRSLFRRRGRDPKSQADECEQVEALAQPNVSSGSTLSVRSIGRRLSRSRSPHNPLANKPQTETTPNLIQTNASSSQLSTVNSVIAIVVAGSSPDTETSVDTANLKVNASRPEHLWDEAYDELKESHPKLMQLYETILSHKLCDYNFDPVQDACGSNQIEQSAVDGRRDQMHRLIQAGQQKNERETKIKGGMKDIMGIVMLMRTVISSTIQAVPQAALPWAIVCMSLEILQNPLDELVANASGIRYVTRRMERYWDIATDILKADELSETQRFMKSQLVELYKELLLFQIKSVCSYYRSRGLTLLRDMVKLDNWAGHLDNIQKLETDFRGDYGDYRGQQQTEASLEIIRVLERLVAFQTEQKETHLGEQDRQCLRDLRITNPRADRKRIVDAKGGLLWDAYCWVLKNPQFQQWRDKQSQMLWIKGDPGKGKTMLVCGILKELEDSTPFTLYVAYFFCQGTDQRFNNANAILRGLIYMFISQQPSLISHVQKEYQNTGNKRLFDDVNAWVTLSEIFENILQDLASTNCCVVIDALDECTSGRKQLLDFIVRNVSNFPHIKWIVSSRNFDDIEKQLSPCADSTLGLEVNADTVSEAVGSYIRYRIPRLDLLRDNQTLQENMCREMLEKANGTFLWAALVFKRLQELDDFVAEDDLQVLNVLRDIPSGLTELYHRMMDQINQSQDGQLNNRTQCLSILSTMALAYQPTSVVELPTLTGFRNHTARLENVKRLVKKCGSFLTIRDDTIYFIHQSARDYLVGEGRDYLFKSGYGVVHREIFSRSLDALSASDNLRRNMYSLSHPGVEIDEITTPDPDPLADVRYSCIYWLRHFCDSISHNDGPFDQEGSIDDAERVHTFFKSHLLIWLEALSLMKDLQKGIDSLQRLVNLIRDQSQEHQGFSFFEDARRFIVYHEPTIERAPLQTYVSALIFSPMKSLVRLHFEEELSWIKSLPSVDEQWSPRIQTLRGYSERYNSIAFSSDSKFLAVSYFDNTVIVWDIFTGEKVHILQFEEPTAVSIVFLGESILLALVSDNTPLRLWDATINKEVWSFPWDYGSRTELKFSSDSELLAATHFDDSFIILDVATGKKMQTGWDKLEDHPRVVQLSDDFRFLALRREKKKTIGILATITGEEKHTLACSLKHYPTIVFSKNSTLFAFESGLREISIWETSGNKIVRTIRWPPGLNWRMEFEGDSKLIICHSEAIDIWDVTTGILCQTATNFDYSPYDLHFSRNSALLVSLSGSTIYIWDVAMMVEYYAAKHRQEVASLALSNDTKLMASSFYSSSTRTAIWNTYTGKEMHTLVHQGDPVAYYDRYQQMAFSSDSRLLAIVRRTKTLGSLSISLWSTETGKEIHTWLQELYGGTDRNLWVALLTFSCDSSLLAIARATCNTIQVWDTNTFQQNHVLQRRRTYHRPVKLVLSTDSKFLAMTEDETPETVDVWSLKSQTLIKTVTRRSGFHDIIFNNSLLCMATDVGYVGLEMMDDAKEDAETLVPIQLQPGTTEVLKEHYTIQFPHGSVIYWNLKKLIFLPSGYRMCYEFYPFASSSSTIMIATEQRGILTFEFSRPRQDESQDWTPWKFSKLFVGQSTDSGSH